MGESGVGRLVAGSGTVLLGLWLFVVPFVATSAGMPLAAASKPAAATASAQLASASSGSHSTAANATTAKSAASKAAGSKPQQVVLDRGVAFGVMIPGIALVLLGMYIVVSVFDDRRRQPAAAI